MTYKLIDPLPIGDAQLISSSVSESVMVEWNSATAYSVGDQRMVLSVHKIYQCEIANTDKSPLVAANIYDNTGDNPTGYWSEVSATNRWKMFDGMSRAKTIDVDEIVCAIKPGSFFNGISILNADADELQLAIVDPVAGEVYRRKVSMIDNSSVTGYYSWFTETPIRRTNFVFTDLPAYPEATAFITAKNKGKVVEIGEFVVGRLRELGTMLHGYDVGITDWSVPESKDGIVSLSKGGYRQTGSVSVRLKKTMISTIQMRLENVRQQAVVFIGDETADETINYAFYTGFTITAEDSIHAICAIEYTELS